MNSSMTYKQSDTIVAIYTLVETTKANGLTPMKYILYDILGSVSLEPPEYPDVILPRDSLVREI